MASWRYLDYLTPRGTCPIQEWMAGQDDEVIAALRTVLYERRELTDWLQPPTKHLKKQFKVLGDEHAGLAELRFGTTTVFTSDERIFRIAGWFRPEERTFILFTGCEKLMGGQTEVPSNTFDIALGYKTDLENGVGTVHDHED